MTGWIPQSTARVQAKLRPCCFIVIAGRLCVCVSSVHLCMLQELKFAWLWDCTVRETLFQFLAFCGMWGSAHKHGIQMHMPTVMCEVACAQHSLGSRIACAEQRARRRGNSLSICSDFPGQQESPPEERQVAKHKLSGKKKSLTFLENHLGQGPDYLWNLFFFAPTGNVQ